LKVKDLLPGISPPVAYYPGLNALTGSPNATLLLCQLIYWSGKQRDPGGWIYKRAATRNEGAHGKADPADQSLEDETGLNYRDQWVARRQLRTRGFLRERYARSEHRLYYQVDFGTLGQAWKRHLSRSLLESKVAPAKDEDGTCEDGSSLNGTSRDYPETTSEIPATTTSYSTVGFQIAEEIPERIPSTPVEAMQHPDIQTFTQVCGRVPGVDQYRVVIETIRYFRAQKGDKAVEYLRPFWLSWSARRRRSDGRPYDPASLTWLTEWAVNGAIPTQNGGSNDKNRPHNSQPRAHRATELAADRAAAARINGRRGR
jgi:hypothetical protein